LTLYIIEVYVAPVALCWIASGEGVVAVWRALRTRLLVAIAVAFAITTSGSHWTPAAAVPSANAATASSGDHETGGKDEKRGQDDGDERYSECVPQKGALVGPVCVTLEGVGEDVLIT
jgi:hypothetical protein